MFDITKYSHKMEESLNHFIRYVKEMSVGSASPALIENVPVEAYGSLMKLFEIASISVSDAVTLTANPFDHNLSAVIEKSINAYNKNLSCSNKGSTVYIRIPKMTEEIRKDFIKNLKLETENVKIKMRDIRRHGMDDVKHLVKDVKLSEDLQKLYEKEIDELTHKFTDKADELFKKKEEEIMKI